jgi:glycosyltransferase involved in cell wall biosynthesis
MPAILHVCQPTDHGVARCVRQLVADQVSRGWQVTVACPTGPGDLAESVVASGARHVPWPAQRSPTRGLRLERSTLATALTQSRPDVVHLHSSKAGLSGRALLRGRTPTIFQPHAWSFEALDGPTRAAAAGWERWAARWTQAVVCCSEAEAKEGEAAGVRATWRVVPNGVDLVRFPAVDQAGRLRARTQLGLDQDRRIAVCVGRISQQKGQDLLVSAWPSVRERVADALLVLVGSGPDEAALRAAAGPGVELVGEQRLPQAWLAAADVAVLPSRYEGMALGVLEALATGRSVVATDAAGMREAIGEEEEDAGGVVVPVGDVAAIARAVAHRLLDEVLREAEGRRARRRAEQNHDIRRCLDALGALAAEVARPA